MDKNTKLSNETKANLPKDSFNSNLSARPKEGLSADQAASDPDLAEATPIDFGEMNLRDAQQSGYTDKKGHAISKAKEDVTGSPTGAYTDIGAGRSSVVHAADEKDQKH